MKQAADKYINYWLISLDGRTRTLSEPVSGKVCPFWQQLLSITSG